MAPLTCKTYGAQAFIRASIHGSLETTLQGEALESCRRRQPRSKGSISAVIKRVRLNHQFKLGPIEPCNAAGIGAAQHRLHRLSPKPEHHRQPDNRAREEDVLHLN